MKPELRTKKNRLKLLEDLTKLQLKIKFSIRNRNHQRSIAKSLRTVRAIHRVEDQEEQRVSHRAKPKIAEFNLQAKEILSKKMRRRKNEIDSSEKDEALRFDNFN